MEVETLFVTDAVKIAYHDFAPEAGPKGTVLLIHGFGSNARVNWLETGWIRHLSGAGYRVLAFDHRGHGLSEKVYEAEHFYPERMAEDAIAVLDAAGVDRAFVLGYSMGARVSAALAAAYPERTRAAVLAGLGEVLIKGQENRENIALALEAEDASIITDPDGKAFRRFAEITKSDRRALAACMRAPRHNMTPETLSKIAAPVLVVIGDQDAIAGPPEPLLAALPGAEFLPLPGKDHMSAVGDPSFKAGAVDFFTAQGGHNG